MIISEILDLDIVKTKNLLSDNPAFMKRVKELPEIKINKILDVLKDYNKSFSA